MLLDGKGCPSCKGVRPVWCELDNSSPILCEDFHEGRCRRKDKCDHQSHSNPDDLEDDFLEDITDGANTDEDPIKLIDNYLLAKREHQQGRLWRDFKSITEGRI